MNVQYIHPEEQMYNLRHRVLRPHQAFRACQYEKDYNADAFHLGIFHNDELISVASFYHEPIPGSEERGEYRLRAMATDESYRKQGAGRAIVRFAENVIEQQGGSVLWCKGRTSVQEYYEKLGFRPHGDVFDYPPIGPHIIMKKSIK